MLQGYDIENALQQQGGINLKEKVEMDESEGEDKARLFRTLG